MRTITPRAARFAIRGTEVHWVGGDPQLTHTVNTLSLLQRGWLLRRLALIAAIEHFTTMLGAWVLEAEPLTRRIRRSPSPTRARACSAR